MGREASACGTVRPGNYVHWVPVCDLPQGHGGRHEGNAPPFSRLHDRYWWTADQQGLSVTPPARDPS